ncbi:hypothetical protein SLEP1_g13960 [Rubroshorea leprosula]|uniref:3'-5' exonuclease domain-containing protein n=1 Tax=Rubroshorea leprosula TaxID=152421 RepID=A0AAV5INK7_9ROSI|nr:hypothetical protein SLEP1_g13960 [Rubroshorea leprosula]
MNIPLSLLSSMSTCQVQIHGVCVKAHLIDHAALVDSHIAQTKTSMKSCSLWRSRLFSLDVKTDENNVPQLLILCAGTQCFIIQLGYLESYPYNLSDLFSQEDFCFVSARMSLILRSSITFKLGQILKIGAACKNGIDLGYMAARVLKNPDLIQERSLEKLAEAAGVTLKQPTLFGTKTPAWSARVFTAEQIKLAIHDAYAEYLIGFKLLEKIYC